MVLWLARLALVLGLVAGGAHAIVTGPCRVRSAAASCSNVPFCYLLVDNATIIRIPLFSSSNYPEKAPLPIDISRWNFVLQLDDPGMTTLNFTRESHNLTVTSPIFGPPVVQISLPSTLVSAFGVAPASWYNLSVLVLDAQTNDTILPMTMIAIRAADIDVAQISSQLGVSLNPAGLYALRAAIVKVTVPQILDSMWAMTDIWDFKVYIIQNGTEVVYRDECATYRLFDPVQHVFICNLNETVAFYSSGDIYYEAIVQGLVIENRTRMVAYLPPVVKSYNVVAYSGVRYTAITTALPFNVTITTEDVDLSMPASLADIDFFSVSTGTRSFECKGAGALHIDSPGRSVRCLVPGSTMTLTPSVGVAFEIYGAAQFISTNAPFSVVNQPMLNATVLRRIAIGAVQIKLTGWFFGSAPSHLTSASINGDPCASALWASSNEITCNLANTTKLYLGEIIIAQLSFYNGDLSLSAELGSVVADPPSFMENTESFISTRPGYLIGLGSGWSGWSAEDVWLLRLQWPSGMYDCTNRVEIDEFYNMFCRIPSSSDLIPSDGNFVRAFAIVGGAPVDLTTIGYSALGPPTVPKTSPATPVTPWTREFVVPGLNFCRANASLNRFIFQAGEFRVTCIGIFVTSTACRCQMPDTQIAVLPVGDVFLLSAEANSLSTPSMNLRIAFVAVPPGYGFGPSFAPDGSALPGFGSVSSTVLVIAVLSGLIVLVLLTFMIMSGRTGGGNGTSQWAFATAAVRKVILNVVGMIPDRYVPLVPPHLLARTDENGNIIPPDNVATDVQPDASTSTADDETSSSNVKMSTLNKNQKSKAKEKLEYDSESSGTIGSLNSTSADSTERSSDDSTES